MLDAAFDVRSIQQYRKNHPQSEMTSLYAGTELDGLADVAPHLVPLPTDAVLRETRIAALLRVANGKPMLSFLASPFDAKSLKEQLIPFLQAECEDGQRFVLRLADTRILPMLIGVLDKTQLAPLSAITNWWSIDRNGELEKLQIQDKVICDRSIPPVTFPILPLANSQFSTLLDAAEADSIIEQLRLVTPEHCAAFEPGDLHRFVSKQLRYAQLFNVEYTPDRVAYCIGAFNMQGKLHENRYAKAMLDERTWRSGDLAGALAELPEECWVESS
jgi:hypothetical protein